MIEIYLVKKQVHKNRDYFEPALTFVSPFVAHLFGKCREFWIFVDVSTLYRQARLKKLILKIQNVQIDELLLGAK